MRKVRVQWIDACTIAGWTKQGAAIEPQHATTEGWLVAESETHIVVAATLSGDEYNAGQQIYRPMVQSIEDVA